MASVRAEPATPRRATIRAELVRLVLVVVLPLIALGAWDLYDDYQSDSRQARAQVSHLAKITASETTRFLGETHRRLNALAARPALRALDGARCDPILKQLLEVEPRYANVATHDMDARIICSAAPLAGPTRGDPERFIKLLRGPDQLTVGKAGPSVITGKWVVPLGRPLLDARGAVAGAVVLPVDLLTLPVLPSLEGLPANAVVGLIEGDGTVLARSVDAQRFLGTKAGAGRTAQRERSGTAEVMGIDGIRRIQGFVPVPGTDWVAIASVPASAVYAGVNARIAASALIAIAVLAAALLLALYSSRRIHGPIAALAGVADEVAAGNLAARALIAGAAEIAHVAAQFNAMLDARGRVEIDLREGEEKFRSLVESASDAIMVSDLQGRLRDVNAAGCRMFGYTREELLAMHAADLVADAESARVAPEIARLNTGAVSGSDWQCRRKDGTLFPAEASATVLPDGRVLAILRDVTDRKATEVERLRLLTTLEASLNEIYIFDAETLRFTYVNRGALRNLGYSADAMRAMTPLQLKTEHSEASFRELISPLVRGEQESIRFETAHRRADGTRYPVEVHLQLVTTGGRREFLAVILDISLRAAAAAELRAAHDRFQKIFHAAPLPGAVSTLEEGRLIEVNEAYCVLMGLSRESLIGRSVLELGVWSNPGERAAMLERLRRNEGVKGLEVQVRRKSGETRDLLLSAERIEFLDQDCTLQMGVDITERRRAEEALRISEAKLREAQHVAKLAHAVLAPDGSFESSSENLPAMLKMDSTRLPKSTREWLRIVHPDDREAFRGLSIESTKRRTRFEMEYRLQRGDGAWINVRHVAEPIREDSGSAGPARWFGTMQDITAHKRDAILLAGQGRVLELIASGAPLEESLVALVRILEEIISDSVGSILLMDDEGLHLRHGAAPGLPQDYIRAIDGVAIGPRVGSFGTAAFRREQVIVGDIATDPLWVDFRDLALAHGLRACWSMPILDAERRVLGTFAMYFREPRFPAKEELRSIEALTHTAAVAVEKARGAAALSDASTRLRELSRRLLEAQEAERRAISHELHDEIGGVLTAVKLNLQSLRGRPAGGAGSARRAGDAALADGLALVDGAIQSVRSLSLDLHPAVLDDLGLIPALKWYCGRTEKRAGVPIELALQPIDLKAVPQLEIACFRIVQEAVTNALRHAKASSIRVALRRSDGSFVLEIADDGKGFNASAARQRVLAGESSGLLGMEERAKLLGGQFNIDAAPGAGTCVRAVFAFSEDRFG